MVLAIRSRIGSTPQALLPKTNGSSPKPSSKKNNQLAGGARKGTLGKRFTAGVAFTGRAKGLSFHRESRLLFVFWVGFWAKIS